jgi:hypothetical protein
MYVLNNVNLLRALCRLVSYLQLAELSSMLYIFLLYVVHTSGTISVVSHMTFNSQRGEFSQNGDTD